MLTVLHRIGWVACVVYATIPSFWLMVHRWTNYWRSRRTSPYRVLVPIWVGMWVLLGLIASPWRDLLLYDSWWTWIPAAVLFAIGAWIYRRSGTGFSAVQLGGLPEVTLGHREQKLAISGIRAHVRHPVYLGHFCEMVAWSVGTGLTVCYALTTFALVTGAIMIRLEDRELEQRFGEEYRDYRSRVPAILPKILSK